MRATRLVASALLAAALPLTTSAQIKLTEIATVDLDSTANPANPEYIGSNPSAVAWDGADLFAAGFNGGGATSTAIVKVQDALGTQTFGPAFGVQIGTPASRGYSGLDVGNPGLAASYDDGATDPKGITMWQAPGLTGGTELWARSARGGSGVGLDPGNDGDGSPTGSGAGWTSFGSGRRSLQDFVTGADIYDSTNGMIINGAGTGTFWRDMEFDDDTGDIWLREGNNVIQGERSGDNSLSATILVVDEPEADFVNGQNIAYLSRGASADFVIYNDRTSTGLGQDFFKVVKVIDTSGDYQACVDWGGFSPATGSGYYDFSWDEATQTLAILDFTNRKAHIFSVQDSTPPNFCGAPGQISVASGGEHHFSLNAGAGLGGQLYLVLGSTSGTTPGTPADSYILPLNIDTYFLYTLDNANGPVLQGTFGTLDATGSAHAAFVLPTGLNPGLAGQTLHHAYATIDPITLSVSFTSIAVPVTIVP
jgi:hypothetical protein